MRPDGCEDCDRRGGKNNYDFIVNRHPSDSSTSIESISAAGETVTVGAAAYAVNGNRICYAVPLSALGVSSGSVVQIKVTDNLNVQTFLDTDDFYISGDCVPIGRLNYAYKVA